MPLLNCTWRGIVLLLKRPESLENLLGFGDPRGVSTHNTGQLLSAIVATLGKRWCCAAAD